MNNRKKEEGSSATSNVRDVTDRIPMEERKRGELDNLGNLEN